MSYYCCSVTKPCPVLCDLMDCAHRAPLVLHSSLNLLKFMSIESVMLSNYVILWCHLLWLFQSSSIKVFPVNQLFTSGGQSIGASVSASVLLMKIQGWFTLGWTGLISLQSKGLSRVFSNNTNGKHQFFTQPSLWSNSHIYTWLLENHSFDYRDLCPKVTSLLSIV